MQTHSSYKHVQIANIVQSTNYRGKPDDESLAELAASIKEKGVLVPVILRPLDKNGHDSGRYDLVAGQRRLKAAQLAGLKEIPATIRELTDEEAKEVQIIENLQREDVHPLDEALAFRALIQTMRDVKAVAARVGKPEAYVKRRLILVQLGKEASDAYRAGKIHEGHAEAIAPLSVGNQKDAVKHVASRSTAYAGVMSVADLKEWIADQFSTFLAVQPWLTEKGAAEAVGACKECPPNRDTLFGSAKEGECTDKTCWRRKMDAYLKWKKTMHEGAVLIADDWQTAKAFKALSPSDYEKADKRTCKKSVPGVWAHGKSIGKVVAVCRDKKGCKTHWPNYAAQHPTSMTAEERAADEAKRKKERELLKQKETKAAKELFASVQDVDLRGDAVAEIILDALTNQIDESESFLRGLGVEVSEEWGWSDWQREVEKAVAGLEGADAKLRAALLLVLLNAAPSDRKKLIAKLTATPPKGKPKKSAK